MNLTILLKFLKENENISISNQGRLYTLPMED